MGKVHLFLGIIVVIVFVLTGQYMHRYFNHLQDMEMMQRALFRAGHLYILLFGLINMGLGAYWRNVKRRSLRALQLLGSMVILLATSMIVYSFFKENPSMHIERSIARFSLYFILFGVSCHGFVGLFLLRGDHEA